MLKSFRRKRALRRHPELDPHWQVSNGHPEALPLREELFWFVVPIADLKANARETAKPGITDFFWHHLGTAAADLNALASYTSWALQDIARFAIRGIAERTAETGPALTEADRERSLELMAELARDGDYGLRMTVVESLPLLLQEPSLCEKALEIAITQVSDDNYYVWEPALDAIVSLPDAAAGLQQLIETGSAEARCRAPRAILKLAQERPDAVSASLLDSATDLLADEQIGMRHIAATAFLELVGDLPARAAQLQAALGDNLAGLVPAFVSQFADKNSGWARSTVATQAADLCRHVEPAIELVVEMLNDDRAGVREGGARTICQLGTLDAKSLKLLDNRQRTETDWNAQLWMTAAIEAVTGEILPVERWPVVPPVWQMEFFECENEDAVPAGVRFEERKPLTGLLKLEYDTYYLYWPDDHGLTSSERLLDNYRPLSLAELSDEAARNLEGKEVDITGSYRKHKVKVATAVAHAKKYYKLRGSLMGSHKTR